MHSTALWGLFVLQVFHVLFLSLHDWMPFGSLNDLRAVQAENSRSKLIADTLMGAVPFAFGLAAIARMVIRLPRDQLCSSIHWRIAGVVDSILLSSRPGSRGTLSGDVRAHP